MIETYIKKYNNFEIYCQTDIVDSVWYADDGKVFVNKETDESCGNILTIYRVFYDKNNKRLDNYQLSDDINNYFQEDEDEYEYRKI